MYPLLKLLAPRSAQCYVPRQLTSPVAGCEGWLLCCLWAKLGKMAVLIVTQQTQSANWTLGRDLMFPLFCHFFLQKLHESEERNECQGGWQPASAWVLLPTYHNMHCLAVAILHCLAVAIQQQQHFQLLIGCQTGCLLYMCMMLEIMLSFQWPL